ncbi:MAG: YeeE/YedE family protein [Rhodospirillales bacterium]|nr:YeeE/YedE family protein [Rhodospirillales bacterium]
MTPPSNDIVAGTVEVEAEAPAWLEGFREDFRALFVERWSPYIGAIVLVALSLGLMMDGQFWGVFGGLKLWGDWFHSLIGVGGLLGIGDHLENPLMHRISLMNITLILGACAAAMMSGDFQIAKARRLDYVWGAVGGTFMGVGASLAGGCTVGGFFTPALFFAASAWVNLFGLMIGAIVGLKVLMWTLGNIKWGTTPPKPVNTAWAKTHGGKIGAGLALAMVAWAAMWLMDGDEKLATRAIVVLGGFALGFTLHRSRFCVARAIREPFMTGDGTMTKALLVGLALGLPLASLLLQREIVDPYLANPARFWIGSLLGGGLFGFGMIFASGCGSGALWRAGEGQVKLWVAVFFFAWSGSLFNALVKPFDLLTAEMTLDLVEATMVGEQAYLPVLLGGWGGTYALTAGLLGLWYVFVRYNESTERFTVV